MSEERRRDRAVVLLAVGLVTAALHVAHLAYLARAHGCDPALLVCPAESVPWMSGDTLSYMALEAEIRERGFLGASYGWRTPGLPLLLLVSAQLTGQFEPVLWLVPFALGAAAAAIAWLGWELTGRRRGAIVAGALFAAWPNLYQVAPLVITDALHAAIACLALACTYDWRQRARCGSALAAGALWTLAILVRPTFTPLPVFLPVLLYRRGVGARYVKGCVALWCSVWIAPAFLIASNRAHHGVSAPSFLPPTALVCYSVPRLKEELGQGDFVELREACWERWEGIPFAERIPAQLAEGKAFLRAHPAAAALSYLRELSTQMISPLRPFLRSSLEELYPAWWYVGPRMVLGFWVVALAGVALLARRDPWAAAFWLLALGAVMVPASNSHWVEARIRLPMDLWFLPLAALSVEALLARLAALRGGGVQADGAAVA